MAIHNKTAPPPFKPGLDILASGKAVRGWNEKDKAKLAEIEVLPADQVRIG